MIVDDQVDHFQCGGRIIRWYLKIYVSIINFFSFCRCRCRIYKLLLQTTKFDCSSSMSLNVERANTFRGEWSFPILIALFKLSLTFALLVAFLIYFLHWWKTLRYIKKYWPCGQLALSRRSGNSCTAYKSRPSGCRRCQCGTQVDLEKQISSNLATPVEQPTSRCLQRLRDDAW